MSYTRMVCVEVHPLLLNGVSTVNDTRRDLLLQVKEGLCLLGLVRVKLNLRNDPVVRFPTRPRGAFRAVFVAIALLL